MGRARRGRELTTLYGPELARIHHERFGHVARAAADELLRRLREAGLWRGAVADLGCGTGILAAALGDAGYAVHGVDASPDMLALARTTAPRARLAQGHWSDAALPPGVVAVVAVGEVVNYHPAGAPPPGIRAIGALAARAHAALPPRGLLMLDVAGPGRAGAEGATSRFDVGEDWALGTRAREVGDEALEREITLFLRDGDVWRRREEVHRLALFEPEAVGRILEMTGFRVGVMPGYGDVRLPGWSVLVAQMPGPADTAGD